MQKRPEGGQHSNPSSLVDSITPYSLQGDVFSFDAGRWARLHEDPGLLTVPDQLNHAVRPGPDEFTTTKGLLVLLIVILFPDLMLWLPRKLMPRL